MNLYAYVGGDPINNVDPLGLKKSRVCTTVRNGRTKRCVTMETGDMTRQQIRRLGRVLDWFILANAGNDISSRIVGIVFRGGSPEAQDLARVVMQVALQMHKMYDSATYRRVRNGIQVVQLESDQRLQGHGGQYDPRTLTVTLNINLLMSNLRNAIQVSIHEGTHASRRREFSYTPRMDIYDRARVEGRTEAYASRVGRNGGLRWQTRCSYADYVTWVGEVSANCVSSPPRQLGYETWD